MRARAEHLLALLQNPDQAISTWTSHVDGVTYTRCVRDYCTDGEWYRLTGFAQIGVQTVIELVEAGILEERYPGLYRTSWSFYHQSYRLVAPDEHEDFGDLWVAA